MNPRIRLLFAGLAAVALLALVLVAACDDDDDDSGGSDNSAELAELTTRLERVEVETALNTLDAAAFHTIDDELQAASEIPSGTSGTIERAHAIAAATHWPDDLSELAATLVQTMDDFLAALGAEDLEASKGLATDAHDAWHELQHSAYDWVAGEELADEGEDDHGAEESPAAEETGS
ncbi:MAG: hypothetical protein WD904_04285 [Dehalococcoidia bacterium]